MGSKSSSMQSLSGILLNNSSACHAHQSVQKAVKEVAEKKNGVRKYKSRRLDVEVFVSAGGHRLQRNVGLDSVWRRLTEATMPGLIH